MQRRTVQLLSRLHAVAYRATGGRVGSRVAGIDVLLLTTTGNRTGNSRTVPLLYLRDDLDYIVVASYGGRPHHPDWYLNLVVNPDVHIRVDGAPMTARATTLPAGEREKWWNRAVAEWSDYAEYQNRTTREIPLVRLTPTRPTSA